MLTYHGIAYYTKNNKVEKLSKIFQRESFNFDTPVSEFIRSMRKSFPNYRFTHFVIQPLDSPRKAKEELQDRVFYIVKHGSGIVLPSIKGDEDYVSNTFYAVTALETASNSCMIIPEAPPRNFHIEEPDDLKVVEYQPLNSFQKWAKKYRESFEFSVLPVLEWVVMTKGNYAVECHTFSAVEQCVSDF